MHNRGYYFVLRDNIYDQTHLYPQQLQHGFVERFLSAPTERPIHCGLPHSNHVHAILCPYLLCLLQAAHYNTRTRHCTLDTPAALQLTSQQQVPNSHCKKRTTQLNMTRLFAFRLSVSSFEVYTTLYAPLFYSTLPHPHCIYSVSTPPCL